VKTVRVKVLLCTVLLAGVTLAVFRPVQDFDFLNYDDPSYVTRNRTVQKGLTAESALWAFTTTDVSNWHPLTWLSHMADVEFFGLDPGRHHLVSVALHVANVILMFLVLLTMTGAVWRSALAATLFSLHPLHVESVAWVAERKDLLSGLFWWLTLAAYVGYARKPGAVRYLLVAVLFSCGLMAKPMVVTLPLVLLLLDFWPLKRGADGTRPHTLVVEKVPLLLLSLASSAATWFAQQSSGAMRTLTVYPLGVRVENAALSYVTYIHNMFWPSSLSVFYPHPGTVSHWQATLAGFLLLLVTALSLRQAGSSPWFAVGWLWYLITLVPVIGIVQVGWQAMADRYTYLPLAGLFIALVWGCGEALERRRVKGVSIAVISLALVAALSLAARSQLMHWRSSVVLFEHALSVTEGNYVAHLNLATALVSMGRHAEAESHFREVIRLRPDYEMTYVSLGAVLSKEGRHAEAGSLFLEALRRDPDFPEAHYNMGIVLLLLGDHSRALHHFESAARIRPRHGGTQNNLGALYLKFGRREEALAHLRLAVELEPSSLPARRNLAALLAGKGQYSRAAEEYREILRLGSASPGDHLGLAEALSRIGKEAEAQEHISRAQRLIDAASP
jgi:tetratricopeptide (TPR) repeat protein